MFGKFLDDQVKTSNKDEFFEKSSKFSATSLALLLSIIFTKQIVQIICRHKISHQVNSFERFAHFFCIIAQQGPHVQRLA